MSHAKHCGFKLQEGGGGMTSQHGCSSHETGLARLLSDSGRGLYEFIRGTGVVAKTPCGPRGGGEVLGHQGLT
jgi:hypothetical protein